MDKLLIRLACESRIKTGTDTSDISVLFFMPYSKQVGECTCKIAG